MNRSSSVRLAAAAFAAFAAAARGDVFVVDRFDNLPSGAAPPGWRGVGKAGSVLHVVEDALRKSRVAEFRLPSCAAREWTAARRSLRRPAWRTPKELSFFFRTLRPNGARLKLILNERDRDRWAADLPPRARKWTRIVVPLDAAHLKSYRRFGDGQLDPAGLVSLQFTTEGANPAVVFRIDDLAVEGDPPPAAAPPDGPSRFRALLGDYRRPEYRALFKEFVRGDPATGMCCNAAGPFFVLSPVYVHPDPMMIGANAGEFLAIHPRKERRIDPAHLDADCAHARTLGVNCFNIRFLPKLVIRNGRWLRTYDGRDAWRVYDQILDAVERNGLYAVLPIWPNRARLGELSASDAFLDPPLWRAYCRDIGDAVRRYRGRRVILAWQVGLETASLPLFALRPKLHELHHPVLRRRFQEYLKRMYGTVAALRAAWRGGYVDGPDGKPVYRADAFAGLKSFDEVRLPRFQHWNWERPRDPVMVDFNYFREAYYVERLNELIDVLRANDPNHLIFFDFAGEPVSYQTVWCGRNGTAIRADLITFGGGYIPTRVARRRQPSWQGIWRDVGVTFISTMEYCRSIAYNAPQAFRAADTTARMIGSGEFGYVCRFEGQTRGEASAGKAGARMLPGEEQKQLRWMSSLFVDYLGAGAAYTRVYDYGLMRQPRVVGGEPYDHAVCAWFRGLMTAVRRQRALFAPQRRARVAILRNKASYFSNLDYLDTDNVYNLGSILYQLHVRFDVLTEDLIGPAGAKHKVDLSGYDFLFIPHQRQLFLPRTWRLLREWLDAKPGRGLCVGLWEGYDRHHNRAEPCADMAALTGARVADYKILTGRKTLVLLDALGALRPSDRLRVNFTTPGSGPRYREAMLTPVAAFADAGPAKPLAAIDGRVVMVVNRRPNRGVVYSCGFPLGFTYVGKHNELDPPDAMNPAYGGMLAAAGVKPMVQAPANLGVWISTNRRLILVKKRGDWGRPGPIVVPGLGRAAYAGCENRLAAGDVELRLRLPSGETARWLEKLAEFAGDAPATVTDGRVAGPRIDRVEFVLSSAAPLDATLCLALRAAYRIETARGAFTGQTDSVGRLRVRLPPGRVAAARVR